MVESGSHRNEQSVCLRWWQSRWENRSIRIILYRDHDHERQYAQRCCYRSNYVDRRQSATIASYIAQIYKVWNRTVGDWSLQVIILSSSSGQNNINLCYDSNRPDMVTGTANGSLGIGTLISGVNIDGYWAPGASGELPTSLGICWASVIWKMAIS